MLNRCVISVFFFSLLGCGNPDGDRVVSAEPVAVAATSSTTFEGDRRAVSSRFTSSTVDGATNWSSRDGEDGPPSDPCRSSEIGHGYTTGEISSGGNTYAFELYRPSAHNKEAVPLVTNWHGLGSNGPQQMAFSGYAELAEEEGFVVVAPTGLVGWKNPDRTNWELQQRQQTGRDDVQMAADLIDLVATMVCIDLDRVYATGMSNGGYFSSLLACRLNERIAATFSVAAVIFPDDCQASRALGVGAIHGTDDVVVPFNGGGTSVLGQDQLFELVMPEQMKKFANQFDCEFSREELVGRETRLTVYSSCKDGVEVRFWEVDGGGHTWPGSPFAKAFEDRLGYATDDFDATRQGYQFMSRYSLPR